MSRPLHPLACRIGRAERAQVVAFARAQQMSVSLLMKTALRAYIASQPAVASQLPVYGMRASRGDGSGKHSVSRNQRMANYTKRHGRQGTRKAALAICVSWSHRS